MGTMDIRGSALFAVAPMSDGIKVPDPKFPVHGTNYQVATLEALTRIGDILESLTRFVAPALERIAVALEVPEDEQSLPDEWGWGEDEGDTDEFTNSPINDDPLTNRETDDARPYLD